MCMGVIIKGLIRRGETWGVMFILNRPAFQIAQRRHGLDNHSIRDCVSLIRNPLHLVGSSLRGSPISNTRLVDLLCRQEPLAVYSLRGPLDRPGSRMGERRASHFCGVRRHVPSHAGGRTPGKRSNCRAWYVPCETRRKADAAAVEYAERYWGLSVSGTPSGANSRSARACAVITDGCGCRETVDSWGDSDRSEGGGCGDAEYLIDGIPDSFSYHLTLF